MISLRVPNPPQLLDLFVDPCMHLTSLILFPAERTIIIAIRRTENDKPTLFTPANPITVYRGGGNSPLRSTAGLTQGLCVRD